jgi:hypothetical protein
MATLRRVDPETNRASTVVRASRRVDVNGLVPLAGGILLADNRAGALYRVDG